MEDHMATTNLSRRNFAKGAAIAGALASIPAAAVLADDTEADAELLELGRQLAALFEEHAIALRRRNMIGRLPNSSSRNALQRSRRLRTIWP
jgi:hypothetical protein